MTVEGLQRDPCLLLACYLPSADKLYVVEEILASLAEVVRSRVAYVGIQHGSVPEAEELLAAVAPGWTVVASRIPERMHVDSDAATYVEALRLLQESGRRHTLCYFVHTKGITSGDDGLRRTLLSDLTGADAVRALARPGVGSWGPHLTITRSAEDVDHMGSWAARFVRGARAPVLPYFYAHTIWVARGECVHRFLSRVDPSFFTTPIADYSDRYFAERDLPHLVDVVCGMRPSYGRLAGNHSTDYRRTRTREVLRELARWYVRSAPWRLRRLPTAALRSRSGPA